MSSWLILRTGGPATLPLHAWLKRAGYDVFTPIATKRRRPLLNNGRGSAAPPREYEAPLLPTFVFARPTDLLALVAIAADPSTQCPRFSLFRVGERLPVVADCELAGLYGEEARAAAEIRAIRDGEDREQRRKARALAMRTVREQQKALRATGTAIAPGTTVEVAGQPAFAGLKAEVLASTDKLTEVKFGSGLSWKVETWLLHPVAILPTSHAA